jgi:hypothetical protein
VFALFWFNINHIWLLVFITKSPDCFIGLLKFGILLQFLCSHCFDLTSTISGCLCSAQNLPFVSYLVL